MMMNNNTITAETINACSATFNVPDKGTVTIVNTTPHALTFQDPAGNLVSIPCDPSLLVNAKMLSENDSLWTVNTEAVGTPEGSEIINTIKQALTGTCNFLAIVGSMIAVNAYPRDIVGMIPVPGYERVAPAEKRMRCDMFSAAKRK